MKPDESCLSRRIAQFHVILVCCVGIDCVLHVGRLNNIKSATESIHSVDDGANQ